MDPVSLILAALAAGAAAGGVGAATAIQESSKDAIGILYAKLKAVVTRKSEGASVETEAADKLLRNHAESPSRYSEQVARLLRSSGADSDETILALARQIMHKADPTGERKGTYNVVVAGGKVGAIGDSAIVVFRSDS